MAANRAEDDFLDEEWEPPDDDDDDWDDERPDEDDELIDCPECGQSIYIESEQCPACGHFILDDTGRSSLWTGRSWWWIVLGVLGMIAVILALSRPW